MLSNMNTDGGIGSDVCVKDERPKTLTVARGLSTLDWGQEISQGWSSLFLVLVMARKLVIGGAPDGGSNGAHAMDRSGNFR